MLLARGKKVSGPSERQGGRVFDPTQREAGTGRMNTGVVENLRVQEIVVAVHVAGDDVQQVVAVARHRKALGYFLQGLNMGLEILPRAYRMLVHADRQHHVYLESKPPRIQQGDFALDQTGVLELADPPPDGAAAGRAATGNRRGSSHSYIMFQK